MSETYDGQNVADALAALEDGDHVDLVLADRDEPVTAFVRDLDVDLDGLAGVAERTVTLQTFGGETIRAVLQIHNRPDATVELSHAVIGDEPEEQEYIRIQTIDESAQQTLADGGRVEDGYAGWVCGGCGKHITDRYPGGECTDCGGSWLPANKELLACDRCGDPDASSVLNSEHNRLCDDCVRWENVTLEAYEYDKDDVFQGMDGDFWIVTARLWNHDATEYERSSPTGEKFETTMPWHRREYELAKLDPAAMGCDKQRVNEQELTTHFSESSKEKAREYYEEINGEGTE